MPSSKSLAQLREALQSAGYTEEGIAEALGVRTPALDEADLALHLRRLEPGAPLSALVKLFLAGLEVPVEKARRALAPLRPDRLSGLLEREGDSVSAPFRLTPWQGLLFAHDRGERAGLRPDHVTSVNAASRTLASLTVRSPIESALDVGTGCGVQALLAARHSERVIATDVNPRALRFTELNARLNGLENVECREGNLFEPVAGDTFDLVVSNPPYVISPDSEFVYRDSGRAGDEISREVVSLAAQFLRQGAFATLLVNWVVRSEEDASAPPAAWLEGSGCDAWLLHYRTEEPLAYAAAWNEHLRSRDPERYKETVSRWLNHYERLGIAAVGVGAVVLRRSSGPNWIKSDAVPLPPAGAAGEQILRVFRAQDYLAEIAEDAALLDEVFAPVEPHRLDQTLLYRDGEYVAQDAALVLEEGVGVRGTVDPHAIHVLFGLDGRRPLRELIAEAAEETDLDREQLGEQALATVKRLFALGFLVPKNR